MHFDFFFVGKWKTWLTVVKRKGILVHLFSYWYSVSMSSYYVFKGKKQSSSKSYSLYGWNFGRQKIKFSIIILWVLITFAFMYLLTETQSEKYWFLFYQILYLDCYDWCFYFYFAGSANGASIYDRCIGTDLVAYAT